HFPLRFVLVVRPVVGLRSQQPFHAVLEGDDAGRLLCLAPWIFAPCEPLPNGFGLLSCQRQRYRRSTLAVAAQADLCAFPRTLVDKEPLPGAAFADAKE